jgi:hypothetical protein
MERVGFRRLVVRLHRDTDARTLRRLDMCAGPVSHSTRKPELSLVRPSDVVGPIRSRS